MSSMYYVSLCFGDRCYGVFEIVYKGEEHSSYCFNFKEQLKFTCSMKAKYECLFHVSLNTACVLVYFHTSLLLPSPSVSRKSNSPSGDTQVTTRSFADTSG